MATQVIKTPCMGLCSTVYGDLVCRGCKRFHHEIIHWNAYDEVTQAAVWARLGQLLDQVVSQRLEVFDAQRLQQQLERYGVRYFPGHSVHCWAYQLLITGGHRIRQLEAYGVRLKPRFEACSLVSLADDMGREFLALSGAHYERHLLPGIQLRNSVAGEV